MSIPSIKELIEVVVEMGPIAKQQFGKVIQSETKPDGTSVTPVDKEINSALMDWSTQYSDLGYIAEEGNGNVNSEYILYVDPLDGTSMLERGIATVTIIATIMRTKNGLGLPIMTVVYNFMTGELWYAVRGSGAYKRENGNDRRLHVAIPESRIKTAVCAWPNASHSLEKVSDSMRQAYTLGLSDQQMGALGIAGVLIAQGTLHASACGQSSAVETASATLFMNEVDGVTIDLNGNPVDDFELGKWKGKEDFLLPDGAIVATDLQSAHALLQFINDNQTKDDSGVSPGSPFYKGPSVIG